MNINEEGKYYASMVRKFRTKYKSKNLSGFCKDQKVSYTRCFCSSTSSITMVASKLKMPMNWISHFANIRKHNLDQLSV